MNALTHIKQNDLNGMFSDHELEILSMTNMDSKEGKLIEKMISEDDFADCALLAERIASLVA
jgi:hypothetical protein